MKLKYLSLLSFFFITTYSYSQQNFWQEVPKNDFIVNGKQIITPLEYKTFNMDYDNMKNYLYVAPMEDFEGNVKTSPIEISLPLPNGNFESFRVVTSPIYEESLQQNYPGVKTFMAYSPNNPNWYTRLDITPKGFHAMILGTEYGSVFIDPASHLGLDLNAYIVYYDNDYERENEEFVCHFETPNVETLTNDIELNIGTPKSFGTCELRTYRLALSCTGEYAVYHGGSESDAIAAQVTTMNRVNGVFEREMSIRMVIIGNNDDLIFTDAAIDPFTNGSPSIMLDENQDITNNIIGSANYDIGHVFGTNSGGIAGLGVVCNNSFKAWGVTGSANPVGDPFDIDYVAHEMGHQFRANHTQNNSCNRNGATAVEPGSASTIMGYAGICSPNVQSNSDDYFHAISLQEMGNFITGGAHTCPVKTPLSNSAPSISYENGATITLPISTPFALKATATDSDVNDVLTYVWDQMDNEVATMPPVASSNNGPSFRSIDPSTNPIRYFPNLADLAAGVSPTWEVLPSVDRTMNFKAVVRDNALNGGCNDEIDLSITFSSSGGPFIVNNPSSSSISWAGLSNQTVEWDVANTNTSPISCSNVNIYISYNGGLDYNDTLAVNVPNNGSYTISVPNTASSNARIMVQCSNGTFFNISENDFTITESSIDFVWTGSVDTNWNNTSNWSSDVLPQSTDDVIIPDVSEVSGNFPVIQINATVNDLTIENNASLFIASGNNITVSGNFTNNGSIATAPGSFINISTVGEDIIISAETCPAGSFCADGINALPCSAGTYNGLTGQTECLPCEAGLFSSVEGSLICLPCAVGTFASGLGNTECSDCLPGSFSAFEGSESCSLCPEETYQPNAGSTECLVCTGQQEVGADECIEILCATTATIASPEFILLCNPETSTLTVDFDGDVDSVQWFKNDMPLFGATSTSITVNRWSIGTYKAQGYCSGDTLESNTILVNKPIALNENGENAHYNKVCLNDTTTLTAPELAGATYEWRERPSGTLVSSERTYTFTGFSGTLDVFVTSPSGCTKSAKVRVLPENEGNCEEEEIGVDIVTKSATVEAENSLDQIIGNSHVVLNFYPNPVSDFYSLSLDGLAENEEFEVNWFDLAGRQVSRSTQVSTGAGTEVRKSIDGLTTGMYIIKVSNPNHQFTFKVMVK